MKEKKHVHPKPTLAGESKPAAEAAPAPGAAPAGSAPSEVDALKDRLLRLQADFDNYRKRLARERAEEQQQAAERLILALLPALDHFELGLRNAQAHGGDATLVEGFRMIYQQLVETLKQAGLTPLAVEGLLFNPHEHEAVTSMPSEEHPTDTVMTEVRRGYRLGAKLLRPAQVIVAGGPQPAPAAGPDAAVPTPPADQSPALPEESAV